MLYRDFAPTALDTRGLSLPERQDWLVGPCFRDRDSGPRAESNFACLVRDMGGESETLEVHRFGHWANGWFELVLVHPSRESELSEFESALADYPVLDDMDLSERESDGAWEAWESWGLREFAMHARKAFGLCDAAVAALRAAPEACWHWHCNLAPEPYYWDRSEVAFPLAYLHGEGPTREDMASLLRKCRDSARTAAVAAGKVG